MKSGKTYIGTSGWYYKEWAGRFYPADAKPISYFHFYTQHFDTVEINSSFYHLPLLQTFQHWYQDSPDGFLFAVKASRYITHIKKLADPKKGVSKFLKVIKPLKEKTGPIVFQLPPKWKSSPQRLEDLLKVLPDKYRYAFELRDPSWFNDEIYQILKKHHAAFCIYDFDKRLSPRIVTADFVYIRFHGPDGKYVGSYSDQFLKEWAGYFRQWAQEGRDVYCYFDNTADGAAVKDAHRLEGLVKSAR